MNCFGNLTPEDVLLWPVATHTQMLATQDSVVSNPPDRRAMRRFSMRLPAAVRVSGIPSAFPTETENVSARGIFFYLDRLMTEGARVEITMEFPPQVTMADPLTVRCLARVVRVEPQTMTKTGVAAAIEEYEFVR
jgi:PilZ domain-containing protein